MLIIPLFFFIWYPADCNVSAFFFPLLKSNQIHIYHLPGLLLVFTLGDECPCYPIAMLWVICFSYVSYVSFFNKVYLCLMFLPLRINFHKCWKLSITLISYSLSNFNTGA